METNKKQATSITTNKISSSTTKDSKARGNSNIKKPSNLEKNKEDQNAKKASTVASVSKCIKVEKKPEEKANKEISHNNNNKNELKKDEKTNQTSSTNDKRVVNKNDFYKEIISNYQAGKKRDFIEKIKILYKLDPNNQKMKELIELYEDESKEDSDNDNGPDKDSDHENDEEVMELQGKQLKKNEDGEYWYEGSDNEDEEEN